MSFEDIVLGRNKPDKEDKYCVIHSGQRVTITFLFLVGGAYSEGAELREEGAGLGLGLDRKWNGGCQGLGKKRSYGVSV